MLINNIIIIFNSFLILLIDLLYLSLTHFIDSFKLNFNLGYFIHFVIIIQLIKIRVYQLLNYLLLFFMEY